MDNQPSPIVRGVATVTAFERLNPAQREAACFGGRDQRGDYRAGPLLIIAGAGTGKTNTLAHRVAHLMLEGVSPERILLLTFTRRAALEMTRRAQRIVATVLAEKASDAGQRAAAEVAVKLPWSGTFHSIANRLIRHHAARVGLDANFSVLDRGDAADLMDLRAPRTGPVPEPKSVSRARTPALPSIRTA